MKFVGIVGSFSDNSDNLRLLEFIRDYQQDLLDLEIIDITGLPLFNADDDLSDDPNLNEIANQIESADGVIISTGEHLYTVPPVLKSAIEHLTYRIHPLEGKPILIIGASWTAQGTSRAQLHLRQILEAPGSGAYVFPGNEFLLANSRTAFDNEGKIKDEKTRDFLRSNLQKFLRFAWTIQQMPSDDGYARDTDSNDGVTGASQTKETDGHTGASESTDAEWINSTSETTDSNQLDGLSGASQAHE